MISREYVTELQESVFKSFADLLRFSDLATLESIPDEYNNLDEDEKLVLAYLFKCSKSRIVAGSEELLDANRKSIVTRNQDETAESLKSETSATNPKSRGEEWGGDEISSNNYPIETPEVCCNKADISNSPSTSDGGQRTGTDNGSKPEANNRPAADSITSVVTRTDTAQKEVCGSALAKVDGDEGPRAAVRSNSVCGKKTDTSSSNQTSKSKIDKQDFSNTHISSETAGETQFGRISKEDHSVIKDSNALPKTGLEPSHNQQMRVNLKNGRAKTNYQDKIEGFSEIKLTDKGGANVDITSEGIVSSDNLDAGEYKLTLSALKACRSVTIIARLSVIPDPRDLWVNKPSDRSAKWSKDDENCGSCFSDDAFIVAASKRGRSHAQEGSFRDDDFSIQVHNDSGWHIMVAADGAGSAKYSREGSRIACKTVIDSLPELLVDKIDNNFEKILETYESNGSVESLQNLKDILGEVLPVVGLKAAEEIERIANKEDTVPDLFSTTLVLSASKKISNKWFTASFAVGDGGIAIFDADSKTVKVMCRPDSGEFAGQTRFLSTSEFKNRQEILDRIFLDVRDNFTVLAVMTDGVTDPIFQTDRSFTDPGIWFSFWIDNLGKQVNFKRENEKAASELLAWLDFWAKGNHDDRTIAVMLPTVPGVRDNTDIRKSEAVDLNLAERVNLDENINSSGSGPEENTLSYSPEVDKDQ